MRHCSLVLVLFMVGCGGQPTLNDKLVGSWAGRSMMREKTARGFEWVPNKWFENAVYRLNLNKDGSFEMPDAQMVGKWSVAKGHIMLVPLQIGGLTESKALSTAASGSDRKEIQAMFKSQTYELSNDRQFYSRQGPDSELRYIKQ